MLTRLTIAVTGLGVALAGCCCGAPRPCGPPPCAPATPAVVVGGVPMPQPPPGPAVQRAPCAVKEGRNADPERRRAEILSILDAKHIKGASFTEATIDQIATYLRTVTGVEFRVSPKARGSQSEKRLVSMPLVADTTARQLLDVVVVPMGLVWTVRDDAVEIATPDEAGGP